MKFRNTVELAKREISIYAGADHPISDMAPDNSGEPVNFYEELRWKFGDRLRMFNTPAKKPKGLIQKQHNVRIACSVEGKRFMNHFIETIINGCR